MSSIDTIAANVPQLRLPGQAAAPEGPIDMTMMYLMHHAFRRDLAAFATVVPQTPVHKRGAWQALAQRWILFASALHNHHAGEDEHLWPVLLQRVGAEDRPTLEAMAAEHADIDAALKVCRDGMMLMATHPTEDVRSALTVRLVGAREHLARHLSHEETDAIACIQRVMSADEWQAIEERMRSTLTLREVVRLVPWAIHELPIDARHHLFSQTRGGRTYQIVWWLTRQRFERLERVAFRGGA